MLSLRGHAPCRSLLSSSPSARVDCRSFKHILPRRSLRHCGQVRTPGLGSPQCVPKQHSVTRCCAQPEFEEHTPEIVEDSDLPAHLPLRQQGADDHKLQPSSRPHRLASWALGHQQKGITTLLGFAGVALAGIAGKRFLAAFLLSCSKCHIFSRLLVCSSTVLVAKLIVFCCRH